jgi:hypothetical protein
MTRYVKHVRLRLTDEQKREYRRRRPRGFTIIWYPRISPDMVDATFVVTDENPDPLLRRNMQDIDHELSKLGSHVVEENITVKDQSLLVDDPNVKIEALIAHPGLEGQNDYLRSKSTNVHDVHVYESLLKDLEKNFEKKSFIYEGGAKHLRQITRTYKDPYSGEKINVMKMGQIEGNAPKDINRNPSQNPIVFQEWTPTPPRKRYAAVGTDNLISVSRLQKLQEENNRILQELIKLKTRTTRIRNTTKRLPRRK